MGLLGQLFWNSTPPNPEYRPVKKNPGRFGRSFQRVCVRLTRPGSVFGPSHFLGRKRRPAREGGADRKQATSKQQASKQQAYRAPPPSPTSGYRPTACTSVPLIPWLDGLSSAFAFVAQVPVLSSVRAGETALTWGRYAIAARVPETAEHRVPATEELIQCFGDKD